ncbi:MAG: GAF domain-containing protein [Leptolyngbya sp. SIO4C1]|nr:GAF domain-containing protein [Leptolyngbya sp. SIO4C1]
MLYNPTFPTELEQLFHQAATPERLFAELMPTLGELLKCDRCFLYLRDPQTRYGRVTHCWRRSDTYPDVSDPDWQQEEPSELEAQDPLFAAALRAENSIFVEDVETADSDTLNLEFEQRVFGHRALVHAHITKDDQLWGILQPCVFERPRPWIMFDRSIIIHTTQKLVPFVREYVQQHSPSD